MCSASIFICYHLTWHLGWFILRYTESCPSCLQLLRSGFLLAMHQEDELEEDDTIRELPHFSSADRDCGSAVVSGEMRVGFHVSNENLVV